MSFRTSNITGSRRQHEYNLRRYGLTLDDFAQLMREQDGKCAVCRLPPGKRNFSVDHDHATGRVRGLLCASCNTGLGLFRDDVGNLLAAIKHLMLKRTIKKAKKLPKIIRVLPPLPGGQSWVIERTIKKRSSTGWKRVYRSFLQRMEIQSSGKLVARWTLARAQAEMFSSPATAWRRKSTLKRIDTTGGNFYVRDQTQIGRIRRKSVGPELLALLKS